MKVSSAALVFFLLSFGCKKKAAESNTIAPAAVAGSIVIHQSADQIPVDSVVGKLKPSLQDSSECPAFKLLILASDSVSIEINDLGGTGSALFTCKVKLKITVPALFKAQVEFNAKNPAKMRLNLASTDSASLQVSQELQGTVMSLKIANLNGPLNTTASYAWQPEGTPGVTTCTPAEQVLHLVVNAQLNLVGKEASAVLLDGHLPLLQLSLKPCP